MVKIPANQQHMKPIWLAILAISIISRGVFAQVKEPDQVRETAKQLLREGDFNNAVLVLQRGLTANPNHPELLQDLSYVQYLKKDFAGAAQTIQRLLQHPQADVPAFQIGAMIYKSLEEEKSCEQVYKMGLRKFPNSGVLYSEYGEWLSLKKEFAAAIKYWELGIKNEPNVPGNYYHAAKYYLAAANPFWGLLYGELFINLESFTDRTREIKQLLLRGYRQFFSTKELLLKALSENPFARACVQIYQSHQSLIDRGILPETLSALQRHFMVDWDQQYARQFPFRLFDHYRQLQQLGLFDAYLQWVYGTVANPAASEAWIQAHPEAQREFERLQQNRVFKIPNGQYYHSPIH